MRVKFMFAIILFALIVVLTGGYMAYRAVANPYDFPIDLVYTWVDGNDPVWQAKKAYWQKQYAPDDEYAISPARWRDRDELKYSLRSVEQYMPWVNNIYIVTDNQVPAWLNINHPKIKIVDHSEIFPAEALPVFNSIAIESRLAYIPDLSEHFIYSNDDFLPQLIYLLTFSLPLTVNRFFIRNCIQNHTSKGCLNIIKMKCGLSFGSCRPS